MHAYMHAVSFAVHKLWSHQGGQTLSKQEAIVDLITLETEDLFPGD